MSHPLPLALIGATLRVRGAIRLPPDADHPNGRRVIIQGATPGNATHTDSTGAPILVYDEVPHPDARTARQLAQREKLRRANAAWHAMTPEEREQYRPAATARRITLYNAALSALMTKE